MATVLPRTLAEMRLDLIEEDLLLAVVDTLHRGQDAGVIAHFLGRALQGLDILGENNEPP